MTTPDNKPSADSRLAPLVTEIKYALHPDRQDFKKDVDETLKQIEADLMGIAVVVEKWVGGNQATGRAVKFKAVPVDKIKEYLSGGRNG